MSMLSQLVEATPAAPTTRAEPRVAAEPFSIPRSALRWGPPNWAADEPIAALDHPPVGQVDLIVMSVMFAHRPD